jgi:methyltransferase-like protein
MVPDGVGYLSYNVYPGWKAKEIVRDAMLLRGGGKGTPDERVRYARGMIDFLQEVAPADSVLGRALADHKAIAAKSKDYYLLHEELETFNAPCYFLELLQRAGEHDLAYLAEAAPATMFATNYGEKVAEPLVKECGHSQVLLEQYLDFVINRPFRQTLLVHAERASQISYHLDRSRYHHLHFAAWVPPIGENGQLDDSPQEYGEAGWGLTARDPFVKAALEVLNAQWPSTLSRQELIEATKARLEAAGIEAPADAEPPIDDLLDLLIVRGHARYRLHPVSAGTASTPCRLEESARRMAELTRGDADAWTFNLWHETQLLSPLDRQLLPLLDGTRDREALIDALTALARQDVIRFERDGAILTEEAQQRAAAADEVDALPERLAAMKLWHVDDS